MLVGEELGSLEGVAVGNDEEGVEVGLLVGAAFVKMLEIHLKVLQLEMMMKE